MTNAEELRFWGKVARQPEGCWEYVGARFPKGYGAFVLCRNGKAVTKRANRVAYELANGAFDEALLVCHSCDTPSCCRPSHLFLGTPKDNQVDAARKGRKSRLYGERNPLYKHGRNCQRVEGK